MENASALLFDRSLLRVRRTRAAASFDSVDFLKKEAAQRLAERLEEVTRRFPLAVELGAHRGEFASATIDRLIRTELAEEMLRRSCLPSSGGVVCDEERLPFAENSVDLVVSILSLHWVNDLPGTLVQVRRMLKPDGLFLAVLPGARTLWELRGALEGAEEELTGGIRPRISPFVEVRDAGNLLMRTGFALPMADSESVTISYGTMSALLADLRKGGEANALLRRDRTPLRREVLRRAETLYRQRHGDGEGRLAATVELVFFTGWKPHPSQPQPAKRGSGNVPLHEALGERQ